MSDNKDDIEIPQENKLSAQHTPDGMHSGEFVGDTMQSVQITDTKKSDQNPVESSEQQSIQHPYQPSTQTPPIKKTLGDIENDIANANFDMSDINAFGDHDTPEVDSIGDISTTAQSVLDKIQQQVDSTQPNVSEQQYPPEQSNHDNTFVAQNADKFAEAVHAHNTPEPSIESPTDTRHLDFDFDTIPTPQSSVQHSLMSGVLNLTIFLIVAGGLVGGGYYIYNSNIKIDTTAPVILQAPTPIKVKPTEPTGRKFENLDKEIYSLLDSEDDLGNKVERLRSLPEQSIQMPKPIPKTDGTPNIEKSDTVKTQKTDTQKQIAAQNNKTPTPENVQQPPLFMDVQKTIASNGAVVEQLSIAKPTFEKPIQKNPVDIPETVQKPQDKKTDSARGDKKTETVNSVGKNNLTKPTPKPTPQNPANIDINNTEPQKSGQSVVEKPMDTQQKSQPISQQPPTTDVQSDGKSTETIQKSPDSVKPIPVVQSADTKNVGWRVQLAALTNQQDALKTHKAITGKFDFLKTKPFHVEIAMVKGKKYYRLQVINFVDKQGAMALCRQIKNAGGDCILKK